MASRERAHEAIAAGRVVVGGGPATKAARLVAQDEAVRVLGPPPPYVSRGGQKLAAALDHFAIGVTGRSVLDAGASTGGFTDCVLQRGAEAVTAVDVGRGQLHERLVAHPRVTLWERTNIRYADPVELGGPFDLVLADLSFISLRTVAGVLVRCCRPGGELVVLVKPQFEAGRAEADRGRGVITDPAVHQAAVRDVQTALGAEGAAIMGVMESPLRGPQGNVEFLLHARATADEERP